MQIVKMGRVYAAEKTYEGKTSMRYSQACRIVDGEGEVLQVYQVDVKDEKGVQQGYYVLTEACWATGDWGSPRLHRDVAYFASFAHASDFQQAMKVAMGASPFPAPEVSKGNGVIKQ